MNEQTSSTTPSRAGIVAAFAAVYVIWGSTYLAILYAVQTLPPFLIVGTRFTLAGMLLYAWTRLRGIPAPTLAQWRSALIVGVLMVASNAGVTWSEQVVPSGLTAVLVTTVPLWMVVLNWLRRGGVRPGGIEVAGLLLGFGGVAILVSHHDLTGKALINHLGAAVLIAASLSWSIGSLLSRQINLPASPLSATAAQMLAGGAVILLVGTATGEWSRIDASTVSLRSILALLYLALFGSIVGFSAYVWLLRVTTPALVSTYAFVNPIVAMLLGALLANEPLTTRSLLATGVIVVAVILITTKLSFLGALWVSRPEIDSPEGAGCAATLRE